MYDEVRVINGTVDVLGEGTAYPVVIYIDGGTLVGKYVKKADGTIYQYTSYEYYSGNYALYGKLVSRVADDVYEWKFYPVTAAASGLEDNAVCGIWSGYVGGTEYIAAACNGSVWILSVDAEGVWSKTNIGSVTTTSPVCFFGFDNKLYMLNGTEYRERDASTYKKYTYTCLGTEAAGNYYITVDTVNYKFALASTPTAGDLLIFDASDLSLELDGVTVSYTTGSVTTETDLTASLVDTDHFYPLIDVVGYRPLVSVASPPAGGGTLLEQVNKLNGLRRMWFSPASSATLYQLPDTNIVSVDYVKNLTTDTIISTDDYTVSLANGTVTFDTAPADGTNTIEIGWTVSDADRATVLGMKYAEQYNGVTDNRVFLYGDGSNMAIYSGLDYDGQARADYFPDLNVVHVGDSNTPITSMVRHYNKLLAFKMDSTYSISYDTISLADGNITSAFYVYTVNKTLGNIAYGQAQIVENRPRTLDGRSLYEWKATSTSGNITSDQRNAERISQRIEQTLGTMTLSDAVTFFDKINHEYYIAQGGTVVVQNTENDTWYVYKNLPVTCFIVYKDEMYFGTNDGYIRHFSRDYLHDNGEAIECYWESGSMDFGKDFSRKNSAELWLGLKPEAGGEVKVTVTTDRQRDYTEEEAASNYTEGAYAATGFFSFLDLDFETLSFNVNEMPTMQRFKLKVKQFVYYKLIFSSVTNNTTFTITASDIRVRYAGFVR
jgi:hypothetical protein